MQENWKPILGYEDAYEVSDLGRVRSLTREIVSGCCLRKIRPVIRRTFLGDKGEVRLHLSSEGKRKAFNVASLVLEAFVGPRPAGMEARHRSQDLLDNSLENLYWGPQASGTRRKPDVLSEKEQSILAARGSDSQRQVAKRFDVDPSAVRRLWRACHNAR